MSLATAPPVRHDLALRTNSDHLVVAGWYASDGITPVPISEAKLTLSFERDRQTWDEDGEPLPVPAAVVLEVACDDTAAMTAGQVRITIDSTVWPDLDGRRGTWDLIAVAVEGTQRCLIRGQFVCEEGVSDA